MAHCTNCGSPLTAGSAFCTHCGARVAAPAQHSPAGSPPPAPGAYPPPPPAKGGGIGKILLIVGGVFVLLGVLAVGGLVITGFWVKKKVETAAERLGVAEAPASTGRARRVADACALLSAAEAARATGLTIERAESRGDECRYFGAAAQAAERGQQQLQEAMRKMRENKAANEQEAARTMEDFVKGLAASGRAGKDEPLFQISVKYGEDARNAETGYRTAMGMLGGIAGAKEGVSKPAGLEGIGDRAYLAPLASGLYMVKGDAWVEVGGPGLPGRETLISLARAVAGKL